LIAPVQGEITDHFSLKAEHKGQAKRDEQCGYLRLFGVGEGSELLFCPNVESKINRLTDYVDAR
jgi:hypothetical protein